MFSSDGNGYSIEIGQIKGGGAPWIVRVYEKRLFFRKPLSSDWFLDEHQARRFADQLKSALANPDSVIMLRERKPGWTLRQPPR
jgi:hypothetical protein